MTPPLSSWLGRFALVSLALGLCSGCRSWPEENIAAEREMLDLVNDVRTAGVNCSGGALPPVAALAWNEELAWASRLHAEDMGRSGYFEHDSLAELGPAPAQSPRRVRESSHTPNMRAAVRPGFRRS